MSFLKQSQENESPQIPWDQRTWANKLRKDECRCFYCDKPFRDSGDYTIDHILPKSKGGVKANTNKVRSCFKCNNFKSNNTIEEWSVILDKSVKEVTERIEKIRLNFSKEPHKKQLDKEVINAMQSYRAYIYRIQQTINYMQYVK